MAVAAVLIATAVVIVGGDTVLQVGGRVLIAAAVVILGGAFFQAWRDTRQAKVVISNIEDATGDETAKGAVLGLTHLLREELVTTLPRLAHRMTEVIEEAKADPTSPLAALVGDDVAIDRERLIGDIGSSQKELTDSITSLIPEAARGPLRVVSETLLRPRGVRVSAVLQRTKEASGGVGLSFSVNQLQGEEAARRVTLWEDADADVSRKSVVERLHELVVPASRSLACELLHEHLSVRMRTGRRPEWAGVGRHEEPQASGAVIDFLIGMAYLSAAARYPPATMSFYQQAERALTNAKELGHYSVSYALADALAQQGRRATVAEEATDLFRRSADLLNEAKDKLESTPLDAGHRYAAELNIRASLAAVGCLQVKRIPDERWRTKRVAKDIIELHEVDTSDLEDSASTQDCTALHNLGCAFAIASGLKPLSLHGVDLRLCSIRATECLLSACRNDERWLIDGKSDPDLRLLWPGMLDARQKVLAMAGDGPFDRASIGAIVAKVVDDTAPKTGSTDSSDGAGKAPTETSARHR